MNIHSHTLKQKKFKMMKYFQYLTNLYNRSIIRDKERTGYLKKIVKNRIAVYEIILKKKPIIFLKWLWNCGNCRRIFKLWS